MTKKDEVERAEELANKLFPSDVEATSAEVSELLDDLGCDRAQLRARARAAAEALFRKAVASGKTPPPFLKRAIDSLGDDSQFPTDPRTAASAADRLVNALQRPRSTRGTPRMLEAARRATATGQTPADEAVKEALRDALRRRLDDEGEGE